MTSPYSKLFKRKIRRGKRISKMVTPTCLSMLLLKFTALALVSHSSALDSPSSVIFTLWNQRVQLSGQQVPYHFWLAHLFKNSKN